MKITCRPVVPEDPADDCLLIRVISVHKIVQTFPYFPTLVGRNQKI